MQESPAPTISAGRETSTDASLPELSDEERLFACWLCSAPWTGSRYPHRLYSTFGSWKQIYDATETQIRACLPAGAAGMFFSHRTSVKPEEVLRKMHSTDMGSVVLGEASYPSRLLDIPDPPPVLFYYGDLPAGDLLSVAVIGARDCSEYGKNVARGIGEALGSVGAAVISGMARGVDGIAQQAALAAGGLSYGVLGSGADICYPATNRSLYETLKERGGLLSPYGPGTLPLAENFPPRNRIVSGLSDAVVVVEARQKSGTLITVDMALEQGREVYAVPGRVTDRLSDGCNGLLGQGAQVFLSPDILIRELTQLKAAISSRSSIQNPHTSCISLSSLGESAPSAKMDRRSQIRRHFNGSPLPEPKLEADVLAVYRALDLSPQNAEAICAKLPPEFTVSTVRLLLMQLVLDGYAVQLGQDSFCKL